MKRTIKFRAWWKHPQYQPNGKMFLVGAITFAKKQDGEPEYNLTSEPREIALMDGNGTKFGWNDAKECILMQFTGLLDKNGKEIYEGDVVRCYDTAGEIVYDREVDFYGFREEIWSEEKDGRTKVEVLGNIYQDSELLDHPHTT